MDILAVMTSEWSIEVLVTTRQLFEEGRVSLADVVDESAKAAI